MRPKILLTALLSASVVSAFAQPPVAPEVATRIAAQNALFEQFWQNSLRESPERATAVGDYRYNDRLGSYTIAHFTEVNDENKGYLESCWSGGSSSASKTLA
jgi:hypothetical protein